MTQQCVYIYTVYSTHTHISQRLPENHPWHSAGWQQPGAWKGSQPALAWQKGLYWVAATEAGGFPLTELSIIINTSCQPVQYITANRKSVWLRLSTVWSPATISMTMALENQPKMSYIDCRLTPYSRSYQCCYIFTYKGRFVFFCKGLRAWPKGTSSLPRLLASGPVFFRWWSLWPSGSKQKGKGSREAGPVQTY